MGHQAEARCLDCGATFPVDHGGGFFFHLLRCDRCGATRSLRFEELGDLHLRYLKGLSAPYCVASSEHDRHVQEQVAVEPIGADGYHKGVEQLAGTCSCGGTFTFDAPPRCPECRSARIEEGDALLFYD